MNKLTSNIGQFLQEDKNKSTSNIGQFLQEDNGHFSAMRLAFLSWVFVAMAMWGVDCWHHDRKLQEIPPSVVAIIASLMTGKVVQKYQEKSASPEEDELGNRSLPSTSTSPTTSQEKASLN